MNRIRIAGLAFTVVGGLLLTAGGVRADFVPVFRGTTAGPGSNTTYTYDLTFTNALVPPGTPVERLESGDFITIYDVGGFVSAAAPTGGGGTFTVTNQNTGINAFGTAPIDNPTLRNVTFTYTGPTLTADTTFTGATIVSSISQSGISNYTNETTRNAGPQAGTPVGGIGFTVVPVPEPASVALLGLGGLGALTLFRRRKVAN